MNLRKITAVFLGKLIIKATQTLKIGGGTAAPGLYALKIYPQLIEDLAKQIPQTVIITGTNGKTTTVRMLSHFLNTQKIRVIRNKTGSNLERGIASTLISCSHILSGRVKNVDIAIWELDEAAFNVVAPKLKPNIVVFLNVFRDQLDRYGEVDTVVKKWCQTLKKLTKRTVILINNDDQNLQEIKKQFLGKIISFGVDDKKIQGEISLTSNKSTKADFEAKNIQLQDLEGVRFELEVEKENWAFTLPLPGVYHVYDFLGAFVSALQLKLNPKFIIDSFKNFSPAFGRVEKFSFTPSRCEAKKEGYILLIKNPIGANQVLQLIRNELQEGDRLLIALNDNLADGTDISWIWDTEFEQLYTIHHIPYTICAGARAYDLALRLKYAGMSNNTIKVENSLKKAFQEAQDGLLGRLFILPTYTNLLELQKILTSQGIKQHYWKDK